MLSPIFRICASNTPMAIDGASWNRWLTHGNGYGLYGYVLPHTDEQPVLLAMPSSARPFPLGPTSYRSLRLRSSCSDRFSASSCVRFSGLSCSASGPRVAVATSRSAPAERIVRALASSAVISDSSCATCRVTRGCMAA